MAENNMEQDDQCSEDESITLNVGGKIYTTFKSTLTKDPQSMLGIMFTQDDFPPTKLDDQGRCIIDRDGTLFRYVLNYLRDGQLYLPEKFYDHKQLLAEARYYQLNSLEDDLCLRLNVGGVSYTTTRATLTRQPGSMLQEIFSQDPIPLEKDGDGQYVIESGDGQLFDHKLNYLINGRLELPDTFSKYTELENEAKHFKLEAMLEAVKESRVVIINLDVGGQLYTTTKDTLCSYVGTPLRKMFYPKENLIDFDYRRELKVSSRAGKEIPIKRTNDRYVIDRDGHIFYYILCYLRDQDTDLSRVPKYQLKQEAMAYGLKDLYNRIEVSEA